MKFSGKLSLQWDIVKLTNQSRKETTTMGSQYMKHMRKFKAHDFETLE